ncbi:hypothetical protein OCAR_4533 [Afipia carboxidovorans OM5]|nr:hypothetical protein OCAR_4533 [Afipia carboxidovorans OM5]
MRIADARASPEGERETSFCATKQGLRLGQSGCHQVIDKLVFFGPVSRPERRLSEGRKKPDSQLCGRAFLPPLPACGERVGVRGCGAR